MKDYILGLDLGPNSIGWAVIEVDGMGDSPAPVGFLDTSAAGHPALGVRIFEAGLQNFDTGKEASKNDKRRSARSTRKTLARRRARRRATQDILTQAGLLPKSDDDLREIWKLDPYRLRAEALDRVLADHELGRAIYHLAQRRGFKSNRLSEDDQEEKGILEEISKLEGLIRGSGARTLGEFLHRQAERAQDGSFVRMRARQAKLDLYADAPRRTRRSMYEEELDSILKKQELLRGSAPLAPPLREALERALFFQHDFKVSDERRAKAPSRANLHRAPDVRPCSLEKGERCCERGEWIAQRFRILKEVRNLRLSECYEAERPLTPAEANFVVGLLSIERERKFEQLTKAMVKEFDLREPLTFNLERGGRSGLKGNELDNALANAFGKRKWRTLDEAARNEVRLLLRDAPDTEALLSGLAAAGLGDAEKVKKLLKFRPKDKGYIGFSRKALERIVPEMEAGLDEYDAITKCYPTVKQGEALDRLPSLVALQLVDDVKASVPDEIRNDLVHLTNPVVRRALVEVRKVVNALIREHGTPRRIHVELAREMKQGKGARIEYSARIRLREKHREEGRSFLRELLRGEWPRRSDLDRWVLWREQKEQCPYCGKMIPCAAILSADSEVDHILPRHRSGDDSLNNKVLCCSNCNMAKGDRTPLEWCGRDSDETVAMLKRARACAVSKSNAHGMPPGKIRKFEAEGVESGDFVARQLNDTRYISRLVTKYLLLLYPHELREGQKAVQTSSGALTARLRREWGLNGIIPPLVKAGGEVLKDFIKHDGWTEKLRIDHRHHAVDALVVALASRSSVKRLADRFKQNDHPTSRATDFPKPWAGLREDAEEQVTNINVSHRPMRRARGPLHEETFFGKRADGNFVTRKRLDELKESSFKEKGKKVRIVDLGVERAIRARLIECGWDGKSPLPKDWHREEIYLPTARPKAGRSRRDAHPIRRVRVLESFSGGVELGDKKHRVAKTGGNFCLRVQDGPDGRPLFQVVRRFHAQRLSPPNASTQQFHSKDSVLVDIEGLPEPVLGVVQMMSGPAEPSTEGLDVTIRDSRDSREATKGNKDPLARVRSPKRWIELDIRRVEIDPLGRIAP